MEWSPTREERWQSQEAYIRYLGGLCILRNPASNFAQAFYQYEVTADNVIEAVVTAEDLMYSGLKEVALLANPPDMRATGKAQYAFRQALPYMKETVERVFQDQHTRLKKLESDQALYVMRPAPVVHNETIYKYLTRSRREKLTTRQLIDGFPVAPLFKTIVQHRTLNLVRSQEHTDTTHIAYRKENAKPSRSVFPTKP